MRNDLSGHTALPQGKSGGVLPQSALDSIVAGLAADGLGIVGDFMPPHAIAALRDEALRRDTAGELLPAGVGRASARIVRADIRGDRILWLDDDDRAGGRAFRATLDALRIAVNRELCRALAVRATTRCIRGCVPRTAPGPLSRRRSARRFVRAVSERRWRAEHGGRCVHLDGGPRDVLPEGGRWSRFSWTGSNTSAACIAACLP
jgi:SM-20-related protein